MGSLELILFGAIELDHSSHLRLVSAFVQPRAQGHRSGAGSAAPGCFHVCPGYLCCAGQRSPEWAGSCDVLRHTEQALTSRILLVNKCLFKAVCYLSGDAQFVRTLDSSLQTVGGGRIKGHHLAMATKAQPQPAMEVACGRRLTRRIPVCVTFSDLLLY